MWYFYFQCVALLKSHDLPEGIAHVNVFQLTHKPLTKVCHQEHPWWLFTNNVLLFLDVWHTLKLALIPVFIFFWPVVKTIAAHGNGQTCKRLNSLNCRFVWGCGHVHGLQCRQWLGWNRTGSVNTVFYLGYQPTTPMSCREIVARCFMVSYPLSQDFL